MSDSGLQRLSSGILGLIGCQKNARDSISRVVAQVREETSQGALYDKISINDIFATISSHKSLIESVADKYTSDIDLSKLTPTGLFYFLEREDEIKNPSWKNRIHRFCPGIDIDKVADLNQYLNLTLLAYADTADEIQEGLLSGCCPAELVFVDLKSEPGKPAHFIAVKNETSPSFSLFVPPLEIIMGVRGTKTVQDAITDMLCDSETYRGGKAHQYIVKSGKYLFDKHKDLLESLVKKAGRSNIKLTLVGHSLGAGAASIAGLEFNELSNYEVKVVGFGCPALLSKELAENASFITTVVNDTDVVPRTSAATLTNLLLGLVEFDWRPYAKRDLRHALKQLQKFHSSVFTDDFLRRATDMIEPLLDEHMEAYIEKTISNRIQPELFPPGRVIHLYHDGVGVSGCFVPNDFFSEIDVQRRMVDDHVFHTGYQKIFLEIMRQHKGDHHFSFESVAVDS